MWSVVAHAQVTLDIPAACGTRDELEREVQSLRDPEQAAPPVRLYRDQSEYVLEVALPNARVLRDADCRALFRAAILIAALGERALPGDAVETATEPTAPSEPPPVPEPAPEPIASAPTSTLLSAPTRKQLAAPWQLDVRVGSALAVGFVPKQSLAIELGAGLMRGRWGAALQAGYLTPRSMHDGAQGVRIDALTLQLALELRATDWLTVSAGPELFALQGRGLDVARAERDWATLWAGQLGLRIRVVERGRYQLLLSGRGQYTSAPPSFSMRGRDDLYTTSSFGFQVGLGVRAKIF